MASYTNGAPTPEEQGEQVERVARAMFDADDWHPDLWDARNWEGTEVYRHRARAALAALAAVQSNDLERASRAYAFLGDRTSQPDGSEWDHDRLRALVDDLLRAIR